MQNKQNEGIQTSLDLSLLSCWDVWFLSLCPIKILKVK